MPKTSLSRTTFQYYCKNCNNILKETDGDSLSIFNIEPCPFCGTILSETLQKRSIIQAQHTPKIHFQKASKIPKLILDIPKLDLVLQFFTLENKICISGIHTQKILERICVRAQLPHRYGGLDTNVLFIDGANSSDLYLCVSFAQQYGLDVKKTLSRIITSRAFTVYQLANIITQQLQNAIVRYDSKIVIISNLLYFFTNDPHLNPKEIEDILKQLIKSLKKIQDCLVIVSLGFPTKYDKIVLDLFSRVIKINPSYNTLSVSINDNGQQKTIFIKKEEIEIVHIP